MGREIRRVPADWDHPQEFVERLAVDSAAMNYLTYPVYTHHQVLEYIPLFDRDFESALAEWVEGERRWDAYEDADRIRLRDEGSQYADDTYEQWQGGRPTPGAYRSRAWTPEEATHYQMYETVTEGTPVSPVFASLDDLARYMVSDLGYSVAGAAAFCKSSWAPSFVIMSGAGAELDEE